MFSQTLSCSQRVFTFLNANNYYVIAKDFSWLVAKSRRNEFIAIGEDVEKNLRRFLIETEEM